MFYVGYHRPTATLLLYHGLGQTMNGALAELNIYFFQAKSFPLFWIYFDSFCV